MEVQAIPHHQGPEVGQVTGTGAMEPLVMAEVGSLLRELRSHRAMVRVKALTEGMEKAIGRQADLLSVSLAEIRTLEAMTQIRQMGQTRRMVRARQMTQIRQ